MLNKTYSLSIWLKYLENVEKKRKFNLCELKNIAERLDILHSTSFIFTVAGTNGKGTTCSILEELLLKSGYRVGLYTSPHLISYLERVRINGSIIEEQEHISSFKIIESIRNSIVLSYFEFITLAALILFKRYSLDVIILEVGVGGRLDATNIIDSNISIITNIGIDHTLLLGEDRSSIAREKSGIFRKNKLAIIGDKNVPESLEKAAKEKQTILKKINYDWFFKKNFDCWHFIHPKMKLYDLPFSQTSLSNISVALSALSYSGLKINQSIIRKTISNFQLPGRFQIISVVPYVIIDVAHNQDASLYLFKKIDHMTIKGKIYALVSMLKDKDISSIISPWKNKIDYWYTAPLKTVRTANITILKKFFPSDNTVIFDSIHQAYKAIFKLVKKEDAVLVFGSFFTVSEFIAAKNIEENIDTEKK